MGPKPSIVCVGAAHLDIKAKSAQKCVLHTSNPITRFSSYGGVARNIAENLARLEVPVSLVSRLGRDGAGDAIREHLAVLNVEISGVTHSDYFPTATYFALLESNGELFVAAADMSIYDELTPQVLLPFLVKLDENSLLVLDSNLNQDSLLFLAKNTSPKMQKWVVPVSVLKTQNLKEVIPHLTGMILNGDELAALLDRSVTDLASLKQAARELLDLGLSSLVVTRGGEGGFWADQKGVFDFEVKKLTSGQDVTGAGDAFCAGVFFGLHQGASLAESIRYGLATSRITLQTASTVHPDLSPPRLMDELRHI